MMIILEFPSPPRLPYGLSPKCKLQILRIRIICYNTICNTKQWLSCQDNKEWSITNNLGRYNRLICINILIQWSWHFSNHHSRYFSVQFTMISTGRLNADAIGQEVHVNKRDVAVLRFWSNSHRCSSTQVLADNGFGCDNYGIETR